MSNPSPSEDRATPSAGAASEPAPVDLLGYLKGLGRHWLAGLIVAVVVAGVMFGLGATSKTDPVGTVWARAHVMATMPAPANQAQAQVLAASGDRLMNSYLAVGNSDTVVADTAKILNDGTTTETLDKAVSIYWGGGGQIIAFYSLGTSLDQAEKRANAFAEAFVKDSPNLLPPIVSGAGKPAFAVVQPAFPSDPNPRPTATGAGGSTAKLLGSPIIDVVGGIVIGLLVMAALELRSSRRRA